MITKQQILLIIIIGLLIIQQFLDKKVEKFQNKEIPDVEFPFKNLKDHNYKNLNMFVLTAPFRSDNDLNKFNSLIKEYNFPILGVASYLNFPGKITHPYDDPYYQKNYKKHDYHNSCIGWCYGGENPRDVGLDPDKIPVMYFSESDIVSQHHQPSLEKDYDFIYVCLKDNDKCKPGWQAENRNWELAKKCFPIMCEKFGLKGLLIGRLNCDYTPKCKGSLTIMGNPNDEGKLEYNDFMKKFSRCKFLFLPNIRDASPRVLTEALVLDVPVLLNKNIYAGGKYINEKTGEFFSDENDIVPALEKMLQKIKDKKYEPRKWFTERYSPEKTGRKLRDFIKGFYPELWDSEYVVFTK